MDSSIMGLHHITAIAGDAQRNYDFYTRVLGLRMVKKTVNFDDPGTYHLYYGDTLGRPGSILTFFPWEGIQKGSPGTGMATEINYSVPAGSLDFWKARFELLGVLHKPVMDRFGEQVLPFEDPDGLLLNLVVPALPDERKPWTTADIGLDTAIRGFQSVVLTVRNAAPTLRVITDVLGYKLQTQEGNRYRLVTDASVTANILELVEEADGRQGVNAGGTNHHVAFRVKHDSLMGELRERVRKAGLNITEKIDRNYFYSLYFREPGGILFELASDNPGFAIDEPVEELGRHLMLPPQYEASRAMIEQVLPKLLQD